MSSEIVVVGSNTDTDGVGLEFLIKLHSELVYKAIFTYQLFSIHRIGPDIVVPFNTSSTQQGVVHVRCIYTNGITPLGGAWVLCAGGMTCFV